MDKVDLIYLDFTVGSPAPDGSLWTEDFCMNKLLIESGRKSWWELTH